MAADAITLRTLSAGRTERVAGIVREPPDSTVIAIVAATPIEHRESFDSRIIVQLESPHTMIDFDNKGFFKLKQDGKYAETVAALLLGNEKVVDAYRSMRDGVVFTDRRIIAINVQGITGSKKDFTSLPYKNIVAYSIETSGTFDLDSELEIYFSSVGKVKFEFTGSTGIVAVSKYISEAIL